MEIFGDTPLCRGGTWGHACEYLQEPRREKVRDGRGQPEPVRVRRLQELWTTTLKEEVAILKRKMASQGREMWQNLEQQQGGTLPNKVLSLRTKTVHQHGQSRSLTYSVLEDTMWVVLLWQQLCFRSQRWTARSAWPFAQSNEVENEGKRIGYKSWPSTKLGCNQRHSDRALRKKQMTVGWVVDMTVSDIRQQSSEEPCAETSFGKK